jgi:endoglucanase
MSKRKNNKIIFSALAILIITSLCSVTFFTTLVSNAAGNGVTPVGYYGQMVVNGNKINGSKTNAPMQVKGMSFFWTNWSGPYYNASTVDRMVDEFQCEIVRAAYAVDDKGAPYSSSDEAKVRELVNAAINRGVYVIIDWHSHGAQNNTQAAKDFFGRMASEFGSYDNVIFEIYNEPLQIPWTTIKSYAEQVIPVIRQHSDNLIVVGTPTWSQDVEQAANNPINASNIAYTLHFYAGTHTQYLRDKANDAMSRGIALFVTEWGTCDADGDGSISRDSTNQWQSWMDQNKISSCNWAVNDKAETSSIFNPGGSLTAAGTFLKEIFSSHAQNAEWRKVQVTVPPDPTNTPYQPINTPTPTPYQPIFTSTPVPAVQDIPGRIEAESFSAMSGVENEVCSEGGNNVGYIDSGDWMDYNVYVNQAGTYDVDFRIASMDGASGAFVLQQGFNSLCTIDAPATGDWQNWVTVTSRVNLQAGSQTLRISANNSLWNINWIDFRPVNAQETPFNPSIKYGDLNSDGAVNSTDYANMKRYLLGIPLSFDIDQRVADVNGDGSVNSTDYSVMKRYLLGVIGKFPAEG